MRVEEFKFNLVSKENKNDIYSHWSKVLNDYFKQLYNTEGILTVENLKYLDGEDKNIIEFETGTVKRNSTRGRLNNNLNLLIPHKGCLQIDFKIPNTIYHKLYCEKYNLSDGYFGDEDREENEGYYQVARFLIYGQNNCCGASTTSATYVNSVFENRKLGTILQYFKEDICRYQSSFLLTCTDIYYRGYRDDTSLDNLFPYLRNTKVLLNTGWKVDKLFKNPNSNNIVGLFTKDIKTYKEIEENLEVVMKIKIQSENIVKIDADKVTIGCDPELFLKSNETGEYVPSFFVMEGDKNKPTDITKEGHNIQCDNVMVEYGIPPCKTEDEFVKHNLFVQKYIKENVAEPNNLKMVIFPSARFEEQNLLDERAKRFGCDPDYNAHTGGVPNTVGNTNTPWRCSGKIVCLAIK